MAQHTVAPAGSELEVSSFAKGLALGEIHEDMVFPYPIPRDEEAAKVRGLVRRFRESAAQHIDSRRIDDERWIPDHVFTDLGELGLTGLYVPSATAGRASPRPATHASSRRSARPTGRSPSPSASTSRSA